MNLKEIKELIQLMEEHGLTEVDLEKEDTKIRLKKGLAGQVHVMDAGADIPKSAAAYSSRPESILKDKREEEDEGLAAVLSPMVGTFYRQTEPGAKPLVEVGDRVKEGDVLCILEAMKLMNEIKSEFNGVIAQILVENAQPVEFGQPLFLIRKD